MLVPVAYIALRRLESRQRFIKLAAVALLGFALLMAPWWIRNAASLRQFIPLSAGGGTVAFLSTGGGELSAAEQAVFNAAEAQGGDGLGAVAAQRMTSSLKTDPAGFLAGRGRQAFTVVTTPWSPFMDAGWALFNTPGLQVISYEPFPPAPSPAFLATLEFTSRYQAVLLVLAVVALGFVRRSPRLAVVASVPLYTICVHSLTVFISRYFLPAVPALIVLAAAAAFGLGSWTYRAIRLRSSRA